MNELPDATIAADQDRAAAFGFERWLLAESPLSQRVGECLRQAAELFGGPLAENALRKFAGEAGLDSSSKTWLDDAVASLAHIGFLLPGTVNRDLLEHVATDAGLMLAQPVQSRLFARELGTRVGQDRLETRVYRMHGYGENGTAVCLEAFVPLEESALVDEWIVQGVGTHIAFAMKSRDSVLVLHAMLKNNEQLLPPLFRDHPQEGHNRESLFLYCDLPTDMRNRKLRIEFNYEVGTHNEG